MSMTSYCIKRIVLTLNSFNTRWIERYFQISEVNITVFVLTFPHNQQINEADGKKSAYLIKSNNSTTAITTFALRCKYLLDCAIRSWLAMQCNKMFKILTINCVSRSNTGFILSCLSSLDDFSHLIYLTALVSNSKWASDV